MLQCMLSVDSSGRRSLFFRPALHADEASLTSDRLVPLNASVCELPLRIAYSPMSVQVHRLYTWMNEWMDWRYDVDA
jgi:hypothetical protein